MTHNTPPASLTLQALAIRLNSPDAEVRRIAVMELADDAEEADVPLLAAALRDHAPSVRADAARGLETFETREAVEGLVFALNDIDTTVREAVAHSLAELEDAKSADWLLAAASAVNPAHVSIALLPALRELRVPASATPAMALLLDPDAALRREAIGVLGYLKHTPALPTLAALATGDQVDEVRRAATGALAFAIDNAQACAALEAALQDVSWQVREEAASALGKLQQPTAAEALISALADPYWQVRLRAARSLGRLRSTVALAPLITALARTVSNLRKEAALALGEIGDAGALPALELAAEDPDPEVRKSARLALAQIAQVTACAAAVHGA